MRRLELPAGWYLRVDDSAAAESPCELYAPGDILVMTGAMMEPDDFVIDMLGGHHRVAKGETFHIGSETSILSRAGRGLLRSLEGKD